jgi:hypothetical protein
LLPPLFSHSYFTLEKLTLSSRQKAVGILGALLGIAGANRLEIKAGSRTAEPVFLNV